MPSRLQQSGRPPPQPSARPSTKATMRKHHINHNHNHNHNHSKHKLRVTTTTQTRTHTKRNTDTHTNIYTHAQQNPKYVMCNVILKRKNWALTSRKNNPHSKIKKKAVATKTFKTWLKLESHCCQNVNEHHHEIRTQVWKTTAFRDSAVHAVITKQPEKRQQHFKIYHPRTDIQKHKKTSTVTTKLTKK